MKRPLTVFSIALLLASCGGPGGDDAGDGIPLDQLPETMADVYCTGLPECLGPFAELSGDPETCVAEATRQAENNGLPQLQAGIDAGTIVYDPVAMAECIAAMKADPCGSMYSQPPVCDDALQGQVAVGGACESSQVCAGSAYCEVSDACPGTCVEQKGAGGSCSSDEACEYGLACGSETCVVPAAEGAACGGVGAPPCAVGLVCETDGSTASGTCTSPAALQAADVGEACDIGAGVFCQGGLSCALTDISGSQPTFTCVEEVASGAACPYALPDACPAGEYCHFDPSTTVPQGTCRPLPQAGEPCLDQETSLSLVSCASGTACDWSTSTCVAQQDNGAPCTSGVQCWSDYCGPDGTCTYRPFCGG